MTTAYFKEERNPYLFFWTLCMFRQGSKAAHNICIVYGIMLYVKYEKEGLKSHRSKNRVWWRSIESAYLWKYTTSHWRIDREDGLWPFNSSSPLATNGPN